MSAFIAVASAVLGMLLMISAALIIMFRQRVGTNAISAGVAGKLSLKPSTVGLGLGLLQVFVGAGFFALAVVIPRRLESSDFDAVLIYAASASMPWSGMFAVIAILLGLTMVLFGLFFLRKTWRERHLWEEDGGLAGLPSRSRSFLYGGSLLLIFGSISLGAGILMSFAILL